MGVSRCVATALIAATMLMAPVGIGPAMAQDAERARVWTQELFFGVGETVEVHFAGLPGNTSDWIAVVPTDAPDTTWGKWRFTGGAEEGSMEFTGLAEGRYQVRLYFNWAGTASYDVEDRHGFTVGDAPAIEAVEDPVPVEEQDRPAPPGEGGGGLVWTSQDIYEPGEAIIVHFEGLAGHTSDWINVVPADTTDSTWGDWAYTRATQAGSMEFPAREAGVYQVRVYFNWAGTSSYEVQDRHTFYVGINPIDLAEPAATEQDVYVAGEPIAVLFAGLPGNDTDWITVVPVDAPDNTWGDWRYTRGKTHGVMQFAPLEPGNYEVRVYHDWAGTRSYDVQFRHPFTVVAEAQG